MNARIQRLGMLALGAVFFALPADAGTIIGHNYVGGVALLPQSTMDAIGQQKWLFTHASVGANMVDGMQTLHAASPGRFPLVIATSGDGNSVSAPPVTTKAGTIYDAPRGNPGWQQKFTLFNQAVRNLGWHDPRTGIAMDKLCYIDQDANPTNYLALMTALQADYPDTVFVFTTMPLMNSADADNRLRNNYNNVVRAHCQKNASVLFDIADIESHDPAGNAVTFTYEGGTYERLFSGYTTDGGHLNTAGQERVALGWYAAAAVLADATQALTNNLPAGCIAWWPGEDNARDVVGPHEGAIMGGLAFAPAHAGNGYSFDGTNDGVTIPHAEALNVPPTGFTVEFWLKAGKDQVEVVSSIVDKDHSAMDSTGWEVSCWRDTGRLSFGVGDGSSFPLCTNLTDVLDNQFHHVAFAWDQTNWLIYVDGVLENRLHRPTVANNTRPLRFGYHWGDGSGTPMRFFKGLLDDVRLYQRALTPAEIVWLAGGPPPAALGVWGLKTHDPLSQPPTTLFHFNENGTGYTEIGRVTLGGADIEADGLAMSPQGNLFAFRLSDGTSQLIAINPTNAVATVIGPVLASRDVRGAAFLLSGKLIAFDNAASALVEIDQATGTILGHPVPITGLIPGADSSGDLATAPNGSIIFAENQEVHRLNPRTGFTTLLRQDVNSLPDGHPPYICGVSCSPNAVPDETLFIYEATMDDDIYQYLPSAGFARTVLFPDIVPSYNAGRGDLAALPAARVELLHFGVSGANATLATVCRGGVTAWVEFTDDLSVPNWQPVPGTAGLIPFTDASIATPKMWTNLPTASQHRFFRVGVSH